jgi:hypothetical protein
VLNVPTPEIILNEPGIGSLVGKRKAAGMAQHVGMGREGEGGCAAARVEQQIDGRAMQRLALLADKKRLAGGLHPGALLEPCADGLELVAAQGLRGRQTVLQPDDVQHAALRVHLVELQAASLGNAQAVAKHQKQQATVAGLVAGAPGRGDQLANLESGQVAAPGLAPGGLSGSGG